MSTTLKLLLAPFVLYSLLIGGVSYAVVTVVERRLMPTPRTRVYLHMGVLVAPLLSYAIYLSHVWSGCAGSYTAFYYRLCAVSLRYASFLAPLTLTLLLGYCSYRVASHLQSPLRDRQRALAQVHYDRLRQMVPQYTSIEVWENCYPSAFVRGYGNPQFIVTTGLLDMLDDQELECVVAHELAHITGRDNYLNWVFVFRELTFFSPFAQLAYARFLQAREEAADFVATAGNEERKLALASALVKVVKRSQVLLQLMAPSFAHSHFTQALGVTRRVDILVNGEKQHKLMSAFYPLGFLFALVLLVC